MDEILRLDFFGVEPAFSCFRFRRNSSALAEDVFSRLQLWCLCSQNKSTQVDWQQSANIYQV